MAPALDAVLAALRGAWDDGTRDPHDLPLPPGAPPSRGQCGPSALVLHDLLGGELLLAEVAVDGRRTGVHWWNRLPDGRDVDATGDQFRPDEVVGPPGVVERPPGPPGRCRAQYDLLRARVLAALAALGPGAAP
ncbi:YunG family protein [Vallicoccus soli]|uniref:Uncharacterized protein n=1 Tax=Vallicoccus soli TaxID=2339232 RepID=A0A3A3Z549_9ACTN|nr:hypothetical protein [Vallicoccus soli]RJK98078.1 hypothetical protein D5H78_03860 [Vallicoccus soli]